MRRDLQQFIERGGLLWEAEGLPRIAGRIFALVLVSENALSLDEIAETLGVSKASASTDTRLLERIGYVERVSKPGDRKDYYQSSERSFERAMAERIRRMQEFEAFLESGKDIAIGSAAVRERIGDYHFAFSRITTALETALEAMQEKHRKSARG